MQRCLLSFQLFLLSALPATAAEFATIETARGLMRIELFASQAPETVANFRKLAGEGFYDGLTFHRVVPGFVVQGGDPAGDGSGGPGYTLKAEIVSVLRHETGSVAMARRPDQVNPQRRSSGSQFYICLGPQPRLDGDYTIFGRVTEGMDVVRQLHVGDRIERIGLDNR